MIVKRLALGVGIVAAAAIAGLAVLDVRGRKLDHESAAFVDQSMVAIATSWDEKAFLGLLNEAYRAKLGPNDLPAMFSRLRRLGSLRVYQGSSGESHVTVKDGRRVTWGAYQARGKFDHGDASFKVFVVKQDGRWTIVGFTATSPVLSTG